MKIGRNAPCPCGSGKKYKKCCLNKTLTSNETLRYRRLGKVLEKLMPKLIDHGLAVYGEGAIDFAVAEFFGWPEADEVPNEAAIDRFATLFWPWFVFNWLYERLEDEDHQLDGPEERTVAELFADRRRVSPQSPEGQLIAAANRIPYSFLEVVAVNPRESVQVKDLLTGAETQVQETLASESLEVGDILFGRVVQVADVGMFLGMSAYALQPGMKPEIIALRRMVSQGRGKARLNDLYDWDLEIRLAFVRMDQRLHTPPELQNTDGDPLEFHKLIYAIDAPALAVEKLAPLCKIETLEDIHDAAAKKPDGTIQRASFSWDRPDSPRNKETAITVLGRIEIDGNRLTVMVNSARRADTVRGEIVERLGPAARFQLDEITDAEAMQMRAMNASADENDLMENPAVRHHLEQMLRAHWQDWIDTAIPALGGQTPQRAARTADGREAVEALLLDAERLSADDPVRAGLERPMIADVRRRLKLDRPLRRRGPGPNAGQRDQRIAQIKMRITAFGDQRLHDVYTGFALRLCEMIAASEGLNIHRGRIEIWAAAIVYAIAQLNFLFSEETPHCLSPDELCDGFKVKKTTISSKAAMIRKTLELFHDDARVCAPHITSLFEFLEDEDGYIYPAAALRPDGEAASEPLALKPGPSGSKRPEPNPNPNPKAKKSDDPQLPLFED